MQPAAQENAYRMLPTPGMVEATIQIVSCCVCTANGALCVYDAHLVASGHCD